MALAIDILNTNDIKFARRLCEVLKPLDVLLGDSAFCSYADFFWLRERGCDAVIRKHNGRCQRLQAGSIVAKNDEVLTWHKPKTCPRGLTKEEEAARPKTQKTREVFYSIEQPGFRTQFISLITTLLDTDFFSTAALTQLYRSRWDVELDLKHLKTSLGMDILRGKTPAMVRCINLRFFTCLQLTT